MAMSDPEVDKQANQWKDILRDKYDITPKEVTKVELFYLPKHVPRSTPCVKSNEKS